MAGLKYFFALVSLTILAMVATEFGLRLVYAVRDAGVSSESSIDERALLPAYADSEFDAAALWEEVRLGTEVWLSYAPYTVWTRRPIEGRYVNVDSDGLRVTWGAGHSRALEIWMFGGSTTWGIGVPDKFTIPSILAQRLEASGVPARVTNFGQTGFVSTQDYLALMRALQIREAPDIVIMYEGANEPLGLLDAPERVNPHYLMDRITALFEGTAERSSPAAELLAGSATYRFARSLSARVFGKPDTPAFSIDAPSAPEDVQRLARRELEAFLVSQRIARALARDFGFELFTFWQPRLGVGKKPLHASEQALLDDLMNSPEQVFLIEFSNAQLADLRERIETQAIDRLFLISDAFASTTTPVFVDWVHVSHRGNEILADAILSQLRHSICAPVAQEGTRAGIFLQLCSPD